MEILHKAIVFVVVLGILVVAHEWGHFIVARIFKIRVDEFSIGFGPRMMRMFQLGDTEYNLRWIPMGGFVRIAGMEADEAPIKYAAERVTAAKTSLPAAGDELEKHPPITGEIHNNEPEKDTFFGHPVWQRALVIFAGPFMSFFLGYLIFFGVPILSGVPVPVATNHVMHVNPGSEAQKVGLKDGDTIIGINGMPIRDGEKLVSTIHSSMGKTVTLTVQRGKQTLTIRGIPQKTDLGDGKTGGALGFAPVLDVKTGPRVSVRDGFRIANIFTVEWLGMVEDLLRHPSIAKLRQNAGGPIYMAKVTSDAVNQGGDSVPLLMAQISMSLALFNLLPIPILDGGYLLMFFVEVIRRGRRLSFQEQQNFMLAGLAVIGVLFIMIMFNDVSRFVGGSGQ